LYDFPSVVVFALSAQKKTSTVPVASARIPFCFETVDWSGLWKVVEVNNFTSFPETET
jgi:hypothetical protein